MERQLSALTDNSANEAVASVKDDYMERLNGFVNDELDPYDRDIFKETLADYHSGNVELTELLNLMEALLPWDLFMEFPRLLNECEREEAYEYIQNAKESQTIKSNATDEKRTKQCEETTPTFVTRQKMEEEMAKIESFYQDKDEILHIEIMKLKSNQILLEKEVDDEEPEQYSLLEDAFSFIMIEPFSFAGFSGIITFTLQIITYILITFHMLEGSTRTEVGNIFSAPVGVESELYFSQGVALLFLILVQDGLWGAAYIMLDGFDPNLKEEGIMPITWYFGNVFRFVEGLFMTMVTFFLIVQQSNVVELFKDFSAMMFITSMDDVVFVLGSRGYLTKGIRDVAERVSALQYTSMFTKHDHSDGHSVRSTVKRFFRAGLIFFLQGLMFFLWIRFVADPQRRGDFLPNSVYIQLGDNARPSASRLSGLYRKQVGGIFSMRDGRVIYVAPHRNSEEKFIVRYCKNHDRWVFVEMSDDRNNECLNTNFKIQSEQVYETKSFDFIMEPLQWYVRSTNTDRFIPMDWIQILTPHRGEEKKPPFYYGDVVDTCSSLQIDERYKSFEGDRLWSSQFDLLKDENNNIVVVYDRPVFYHPSRAYSDNNSWDLIMFLGIRWGLLSSMDLGECRKSMTKQMLVEECLQKFHGFYSEYNVSFVSDVVKVDSPEDYLTPERLKWFVTRPDNGPDQSIDVTQSSIDATLICTTCTSQKTIRNDFFLENPCFFGNECIDGKCQCRQGTRGTLCQVAPTNDAHCDIEFNNPQYNFDGGDCCLDTCVSTDARMCGTDGYNFVNYDNCKQKRFYDKDEAESTENFWRKKEEPIGTNYFVDNMHYTVSATSNGRTVVVGDPIKNEVVVMDQDGSKWNMRGATIKRKDETLFGSEIHAISPFFSAVTQEYHSPLTILISSNSSNYIYDWDPATSDWKDVTPTVLLSKTRDSNVSRSALLSNRARTFVISSDDGLIVLQRDSIDSYWEELQVIEAESQSFSISDTASDLILLGQKNNTNQSSTATLKYFVKMFGYFQERPISMETSDNILAAKLSSNGKALVVCTKRIHTQQVGDIWVYFKNVESEFSSFLVPIRDVSMTTPQSLFVSNNGAFVCIKGSTESSIRIYHWNGNTWNEMGYLSRYGVRPIQGTSFSVSNDFKSIIVANSPDTREKIWVYTFNELETCAEDEFIFRYSMNMDEYGDQVLSAITTLDELKDEEVVEWQKNTALSVHQCIPKQSEDCFFLAFHDYRGTLSKTLNRTKIFKDGKEEQLFPIGGNKYSAVYLIAGPENCTSGNVQRRFFTYSEERKTYWPNPDCYEAIRSNNTIQLHGTLNNERFGMHVEVSKDGLVVAIQSSVDTADTEQLKLFNYDKDTTNWIRLGGELQGIDNKVDVLQSFSLSENGSIIAVGVISDTGFGRVQVYKLSQQENWVFQGAEIIDGKHRSLFGYTVSLSSDGSTVAVGAPSEDSLGIVRVYNLEQGGSEWKQIGTNITDGVAGGIFGHNLDLSSNGTVLAIASVKSGVSIYERAFEPGSHQWTLYGNLTDHHVISVSFNFYQGSDHIAYIFLKNFEDGNINQNVNVFKYEHNYSGGSWLKVGGTFIGEFANGLTSISWSDDTLIIGSLGNVNDYRYEGTGFVKSYMFDSVTKSWHVLGTVITGESRDDMFGLSISSSSSLSTLAISSPKSDANGTVNSGGVKLFKFDESDCDSVIKWKDKRGCQNHESLFHFSLTMDENPQDIDWELARSDGTKILGDRFTQIQNSKKIHSLKSFDQSECVPSGQLVSFFIKDFYGDGLCCDWGRGKFSLFWNDESIISNDTSTNFKSLKTLCLPQDIPSSKLRLDISFNERPTETHWNLYDGSFGLLSSNEAYSARLKNQYLTKLFCVPPLPPSVCNFVFVATNLNVNKIGGSKSEYEIFHNDYEVSNHTKFGDHSISRIGSCETCSDQNKSIVQIVLMTDSLASKQKVSLLDNSNQTLFEGDVQYLLWSQLYYHEVCVPKNECFTFVIEDPSCHGISKAHNIYEIYLDDVRMKRVLGDFGCRNVAKFGSCQNCFEGNVLLQLSVGKNNYLGRIRWEITDESGNTVMEDILPRDITDIYDYSEKCVPAHSCMKLVVHKNHEGQSDFAVIDQIITNSSFELMWNGTFVQIDTNAFTSENWVQFGNC